MATLQKFKLLATQCATAASSPSRSPLPTSAAKSPSFHLRRRKTTLRRLLSRSSSLSTRRFLRRGETSTAAQAASDRTERKGLLSHTSLKDLFVSSSPSPPAPGEAGRRDGGGEAGGSGGAGADEGECGHLSPPAAAGGGRPGGSRFGLEGFGGAAFAGRRPGGGFAARFASTAALRYRLLRRAWRPVLLTIPE